MGSGISAEGILSGLGNAFGDSGVSVMIQLDNGFLVYFHPTRVRVSGDMPLDAYAPRGMGMSNPSPEEIRQAAEKARERQRASIEAYERSKDRIRVYPALSQALEEIKSFYSNGGVIPGIDFVSLSEKRLNEGSGDMS